LPLTPTLFLDCDGVLNEECGPDGVVDPAALRLLPGAADAVAALNHAGILAVGVTNRAQVARGRITEAALRVILDRLLALIAAGGGRLDGLFYCPHLPPPAPPGANRDFIVACDCRKPRDGLLRQAAAILSIDRTRTALVGDSATDIAAAHAFGVPGWGVRTGHACGDPRPDATMPDLWFPSVAEAAAHAISLWGRAPA
jgi:D-glycero-D-manno-heptose 1,7-bisphosphate phosphatase